MQEKRNPWFGWLTTALLAVVAVVCVSSGFAVVPPDEDGLRAKEFRHPDLGYENVFRSFAELPVGVSRQLGSELSGLGVDPGHAFFDLRTGRWGTLILTAPVIPGPGVGNTLQWRDLGLAARPQGEALERAVWNAFENYLARHASALRIDPQELAEPTITVLGDRLIQVHVGRQIGGVPVRDAFVKGAINSGNLVLWGMRNWGPVEVSTAPRLSAAQAENVVRGHLESFSFAGLREEPRLELIPTSSQPEEAAIFLGAGIEYRLAWVLIPDLADHTGSWEALVDAHSGELLSFVDTNHYASRRVEGWVYPVSNDEEGPDGNLQMGFPMPFADLELDGTDVGFATTGGNAPSGSDPGTLRTTLSGQYMRMNDSCGVIDESVAAGDLDLEGIVGETDCAVPPGHSPGDTNSSRTGFYELNRLAEQARGYLPDNNWLNNQLTANMNLPQVCNAFWDGLTVNFFRSAIGSGCRNTGEIAGVFDHEWGHGMDDNDGNPNVSNPGEGIADLFAHNRLDTSCIGRGFFVSSNCTGYGDPCLDCTGIRDIDWMKRQSQQPHDIAWIDANCGGGPAPCGGIVHCEGAVYSEAVYDLIRRDLMGFEGSEFNLDANTALEIGARLTYYGSSNVGNWYQCTTDGTGGCNADSGYLGYLAADDDNGDITDGTPHMSAIFAAFERHQIACNVPVVQSSGCAGGPSEAPANVVADTFDEGVQLTWDAVTGAEEYWIFRTEGVHGCDFGKALVGKTGDTSFAEGGLRNGFEVFYSVVAVGASDACTSPMSACLSVIPTAGPSGFIEGTVTDADTSAPLAGALVQAAGPVTLADTTDADGFYRILAPVGTYDVTASADHHAPQTVPGVEVLLDQTTVVDFQLQGSSLFYEPAFIEETVEVGQTVTTTVTVTADGPVPVDFSVSIGNYEYPTVSQPVQITVPAGAPGAAEGTAAAAAGSAAAAMPSPAAAFTYTDSNPSSLGSTTVLIVVADDGAGEPLRSILLDYPDIETVDVWDARAGMDGVPPLAVLEAYPVVITWSNYPYADRIAMGNVLADYVDGGGLVVQGEFNWFDTTTFGLGGRFVDEGYSPFISLNMGAHGQVANLGSFDAGHPLMADVSEASDFFRDWVDLDPEAELVASWDDGEEFVAVKGSVVGINSYTGISRQWTGDVGVIFHNAINYLLTGLGVQWASAVPDGGTVEPGVPFTFEVIFDATQLNQEGTYTAELEFSGNFVNDVPLMPLTMHLECSTCGTLAGAVTDDVSGEPVSGTVTVEGAGGFTASQTGETYSVTAPADTYTISVEADGYFPETVEGVVLGTGETVTTDFALTFMFAELEYTPAFIEETMESGDVVTNPVTVTNNGTIDLEFNVSIGGYESPGLAADPSPHLIPPSQARFSTAAPVGPLSVRSAEGREAVGEMPQTLLWESGAPMPTGQIRYAHVQCPDQPESFYTISGVGPGFAITPVNQRYDADTDTWTELAPLPVGQEGPSGVCFEGHIYVAGGGGTTQFFIYDIAADSWSAGPPLPRPVWGAAMGAIDGKVFMIGGDSDFFFGGTSNEVNIYDIASGTWSNGTPMPTAAVTAGSGQAGPHVYVVGGWGDSSPATNVNVTQRYDMTTDTWETGATFTSARADHALAITSENLYAIGGDSNGGGPFDPSAAVESLAHGSWPSGEWTDVGDPLPQPATAINGGFCTSAVTGGEVWAPGGTNLSSVFNTNLYRAAEGCFSGGVQWASADPSSGTVPPGGSMTFDVTFDATQLVQEGTYTANLNFSGNFNNDVPTMPLTMHLTCPTCGTLDGAITDAFTGDPVSATVNIVGDGGFNVTVTGETYSVSVPADTYTISVEADGYFPDSATVTVGVGETVTTDFALVPTIAILEYTPASIEETLPLGGSATNTVTVSNTGTIPFDFTVSIGGYQGPSAVPHLISPSAAEFSAAAPVGPLSVRSAEGRELLADMPQSLVWNEGAPMPEPLVRYGHAQCAEEPESFYVVSGVSNGLIVNGVRRYDAATDSWTTLTPIPVAQEGPSAVCYEGNIYVVGGGGSTQFFIYNIASDSWSAGPALPRGVWGAAMGAFDGKIFMIGGDNDFGFGGTSNEVNIYDIADGTWSNGTPMPAAAVTAGSVQAGEHVYVVGGWGDASPGNNVNVTQRYDMAGDSWETGPTFTSARADFGLAVTETQLFAIGGDTNGGGPFDASSLVESLDHTAWPGGTWTDIGDPIPQALTALNGGFCTNVVTGGEVWAPGGLDSGFIWSDQNRFRPSEPCFAGGFTPWASASPNSGTVEPGESFTFEVTFDASVVTELGTYTANLRFNGDFSNDPADMPLTMHVVPVGGDPIADITPEEFFFELSTGSSETQILNVGNIGGADLTWDIAEASPIVVPEGAPYRYGLAGTPAFHAPVGYDRATAPLNRPVSAPADRVVLPAPQPAAIGSFSEGFDDITQLPGAGWAMINNSEPVGPSSWFQGNETIFPSHEGDPNAYIAANYESTSGNGDISNWLLTPEVTIVNGTELCFWTRKSVLFEEFLDRMEVRMSVAGDSTDVGDTAESVGDFTTLLLTIEPDLELPNEYPEEWTEFCLTVRERSREPVTGRFAFRYWVTNSGPDGENGDYIGIDTVSVTQPGELPGGCDNPADVPWLSVDPVAGTTPPDQVFEVDVTADATDLPPDSYSALLCVATNDPNAELVAVPVHLTVTEPIADRGADLRHRATVDAPMIDVTVDSLESTLGEPPCQPCESNRDCREWGEQYCPVTGVFCGPNPPSSCPGPVTLACQCL